MAFSCLQGRRYGRTKAHSLASQTNQYDGGQALRLVTTYLLRGTCLCNSQADTKDSIGAQFGLVLGTVQLVQELVNLCLVCHIESFLDNGGAKYLIDICDGFEDPFSAPFGFVAISELTCFVLPCSKVSAFFPSVLLSLCVSSLCWLRSARCFCGDPCYRQGLLPPWDCHDYRIRNVRGSSGLPCSLGQTKVSQ